MAEFQLKYLRQGQQVAPPILSLRHLAVKVGLRRVIDDLNLDIYDGDVLSLRGPNGSGKSTLLSAIAGLAPALVEAGSIHYLGVDIVNLPPHIRAQRGLAYLRQRDNVFQTLTVEENLKLALGSGGVAAFRKAFPDWTYDLPMHKSAGLLSGGQRQRLAWAMTMLRPSTLLLLDEAEAGLSEPLSLPSGLTCLVVTHDSAHWGLAGS